MQSDGKERENTIAKKTKQTEKADLTKEKLGKLEGKVSQKGKSTVTANKEWSYAYDLQKCSNVEKRYKEGIKNKQRSTASEIRLKCVECRRDRQ